MNEYELHQMCVCLCQSILEQVEKDRLHILHNIAIVLLIIPQL